MIIAIIATVSLVALAQFVVFYWRATIAVTASVPASERLRTAAGIQSEVLGAGDFRALIHLVEICPALTSAGTGIRSVKLYYQLLASASRMLGPALGHWTTAEMATCTRYVAARLDQRISHNSNIWDANSA